MEHPTAKKIYMVEHLEPELGPWSSLEYQAIAKECLESNASLCLSSISSLSELPLELRTTSGVMIDRRGVEDIYADNKSRVCLLDPAARDDLCPEDGETFTIFLFGGILGDDPPRGRTCPSTQDSRRLKGIQIEPQNCERKASRADGSVLSR